MCAQIDAYVLYWKSGWIIVRIEQKYVWSRGVMQCHYLCLINAPNIHIYVLGFKLEVGRV